MSSKGTMTAAVLAVLLALGLAAHHSASAAKFSEWSAPDNLGPVVNSGFNEVGPAISKDGLSLYFGSNRTGGSGGQDIWVSQRSTVEDPWGAPTNLGPIVNSPGVDGVPCFSRDGHWMFFNSDRTGGHGALDIWACYRTHTHDDFGWGAPVNLGPNINTTSGEVGPSLLENDEVTPLLFFASNRPGGPGGNDIYVSARADDGSFGPATLVTELNTAQNEQRVSIRFDGLEIFLFSNRTGSLGADLWASSRKTFFDPWSPPTNLGPIVNTPSTDQQPFVSSDRRSLFFSSDRAGGYGGPDIWVTTRGRINGQ